MKVLSGALHGIHLGICCVQEPMITPGRHNRMSVYCVTVEVTNVYVMSLFLCSKFWCRNRPGDEIKDKYNTFHNPFFGGEDGKLYTMNLSRNNNH